MRTACGIAGPRRAASTRSRARSGRLHLERASSATPPCAVAEAGKPSPPRVERRCRAGFARHGRCFSPPNMTVTLHVLGQPCELGALLGVGGGPRLRGPTSGPGPRGREAPHEALAKDPADGGCALTESRLARRVSHRNVVRVLESGQTASGEPFVIMERAAGIPLWHADPAGGPALASRGSDLIAAQLLAGLAAIHCAGLVRRREERQRARRSDGTRAIASRSLTSASRGRRRRASRTPATGWCRARRKYIWRRSRSAASR